MQHTKKNTFTAGYTFKWHATTFGASVDVK